jgi:hypothetical protein
VRGVVIEVQRCGALERAVSGKLPLVVAQPRALAVV